MNINQKLKQRREKINQILNHKRTKVLRKFKQAKKEINEEESSNNFMKNKIEKYLNVEKMIQAYDKKISGHVESEKIQEKSQNPSRLPKNNSDKIQRQNNPKIITTDDKQKKFLNKKRDRKTPEEIEKEKTEKLNKRKAVYKKLHKKTNKGQPVMKYQVEHIFKKIKDKLNKGLI